VNQKKLIGLILAGGKSQRMKENKSGIDYHGEPQLAHAVRTMGALQAEGLISFSVISCLQEHLANYTNALNEAQTKLPLETSAEKYTETNLGKYEFSVDTLAQGPLMAIHTSLGLAFTNYGPCALVVTGIDLPFLTAHHIKEIVSEYNFAENIPVAASLPSKKMPEPMLSIWPTNLLPQLTEYINHSAEQNDPSKQLCPRKALDFLNVKLFPMNDSNALTNVNTPEEKELTKELIKLRKSSKMPRHTNAPKNKVTVSFFAILREQAGINSIEICENFENAIELYEILSQKYSFTLPAQALRVAINDKFSSWQEPLKNNDKITFIPPVAGG
jgi:sulfur-carrier protein